MLNSARSSFDGTSGLEVSSNADTAHIMVPADLLDYQYVTLHVPLTPETEDPINKELIMEVPKGATRINTARPETEHEAEMLNEGSQRATRLQLPLRGASQECQGSQGARRRQVHEARHLHQEEDGRTDTGSIDARQFRTALQEGS